MYLFRFVLLSNIFLFIACKGNRGITYVCPPCDLPCDTMIFNTSGVCPYCQMDLIPIEELQRFQSISVDSIVLNVGSGEFRISGGAEHKDDFIRIFYHLPTNYNNDSKVLLVVPGAGRNGDSYRDAWIEESEKLGIIVLSPMYDEHDYPFEAYHLGGVISNSNLQDHIQYIDGTNLVNLQEELLRYDIKGDSTAWLFDDFDRLFDMIKEELELETDTYDLFGHSAGGQILHRNVIFNPFTKANKIIAANSGFYTLPDLESPMPFGVKNMGLDIPRLKKSLSKNLVIFCGELDNENEKGGIFLRSVNADRQGLGRLSRGQYFYQYAKDLSEEWGTPFNWDLKIVPNVGHDHRKIGDAASKYLYK